MDTLDHTGLGGVSVHGGAGGSRSVWKGKERADMGENDKDGEGDADGDEEGSKGEEEDKKDEPHRDNK